MFMLAFSAPFVCVILLHNLFFPPFGATKANDQYCSSLYEFVFVWAYPYPQTIRDLFLQLR